MVITVAYWNDFPTFFNNGAIHCLAASIRAYDQNTPFILIINDPEKLPAPYINLLTGLGTRIYMIEDIWGKIMSRFPALGQYSLYESFCFSRWWFIKQWLQQHAPDENDIIIVDGDIIFFMPPSELRNIFAGNNFVMASPSFAFFKDPLSWLNQYMSGLERFLMDINGFSDMLCLDRDEKISRILSEQKECGSWSRNPLGSDQDLINALIANGYLMQDGVTDIKKTSHIAMCENPSWFFNQITAHSVVDAPVVLKMVASNRYPPVFLANASRFTHLHFQSWFVKHCAAILMAKRTTQSRRDNIPNESKTLVKRIPNPVMDIQNADSIYHNSCYSWSRVFLYSQIRETQSVFRHGLDNSGVNDETRNLFFPEENHPPFSFRDIFCPDTWWQPDIHFSWAPLR